MWLKINLHVLVHVNFTSLWIVLEVYWIEFVNFTEIHCAVFSWKSCQYIVKIKIKVFCGFKKKKKGLETTELLE